MKKTKSMLELSDVQQLRRYSSKVSLDGSSRSSLPSISETESLSCSNGTGNITANSFLPMDSSMNRGIRGGSSRPIIVVEEPDDEDDTDNDFFLGSLDIDEEQPCACHQPQTPEASQGSHTKSHENSMHPSEKKPTSQTTQGPSLRYKNDLSASMPVILPSSSPAEHDNGTPISPSQATPGLRRAASVSCLKRRNSNEGAKPKRTISFTNLEIREYDLTIGDNPSVSYGPPVQLSWQYSQGETRDLEDYESQKMLDRSRGRRSRRVENMSWAKREAMLKRQGFSQDDIQAKVKEVNKVKQGRSVTRALVVTGRTEEALESAGRKLKRFFGGSNSSKQENSRRTIFPHRSIDASASGRRRRSTSIDST